MWAVLKGGRVVDPANGIDEIADVLIENGRIAGVGKQAVSTEQDRIEVYDVSGLIAAPGFVDMHVHLREPGAEHKETIESGAAAAAAGGFTTILAMPNTEPAADSRPVIEYIINKGTETGINVLACGAMTKDMAGQEMAELGDIAEAGASALSDDGHPIQNSLIMRRVMEYASMLGLPVLTHCEDKSLTADAVMNEGIASTIAGLRGMPAAAEASMVYRNILLSELTGCRLHIQHVSCAESVAVIREAKKRGAMVTCETCPQYFTLTEEALTKYDTNAKMNPPLRTKTDVEAIKAGLADGTIDAIATDHAPHSLEDKEVEMTNAAFGIVGLETALSLTISQLVKPGILTLTQAVEKLSSAPAKILGLERGTLSVGSSADIVIFDPSAEVTVDASQFKSKARNTPFNGWTLKGKTQAVIAGGRLVSGSFAVQSEKCSTRKD